MPHLPRLVPLLRSPVFRLALLGWTTAVAVQPGTLHGDDHGRLHVSHSLWTIGEPTISPNDEGINGVARPIVVVGPGGKLYAPSLIGQSLVMIPADIIATGVASAHPPRERGGPEVPLSRRRLSDVPADRGCHACRRLRATRRTGLRPCPRRGLAAWACCSGAPSSCTARTSRRTA